MLLKGNLRGLQHIGLPVTNLERSKAFYSELGFLEELSLELYQLEQEERQMIANRTDGHIDHIALDVMDIEQAYTEICAAGLEILEEDAPVFLPFWDQGVKYFTIRGPDGEKVEFNQILR